MLAVNAEIAGDKKEVDRLVKENDLNQSELKQRVQLRNSEPYDLTSKPRGPRKKSAAMVETVADLDFGDLSTSELVLLEAKFQEALAGRDKKEVADIKRNLKKKAELEQQLAELNASLGVLS